LNVSIAAAGFGAGLSFPVPVLELVVGDLLHKRRVGRLQTQAEELEDRFVSPLLAAASREDLSAAISRVLPDFVLGLVTLAKSALEVIGNEGHGLEDAVAELAAEERFWVNSLPPEGLDEGGRARLRFAWLTFLALEREVANVLRANPDLMNEMPNVVMDKARQAAEDPLMRPFFAMVLLLLAARRMLDNHETAASVFPLVVEAAFDSAVAVLESLEATGVFLNPIVGLSPPDRAQLVLALAGQVYGGLAPDQMRKARPVRFKLPRPPGGRAGRSSAAPIGASETRGGGSGAGRR